MNDYLDVDFATQMSSFDNCICDACHDTTTVVKIKLPSTKFHDHINLTTKYSEYWLCGKCRNKLTYALDFPEEL